MGAKLLSIIGPPAVGKTTLAERLAGELSATILREDFAGNPFLAASYTGAAAAKLPAQLYYLMSRVSQLSAAAWPADGLCVSDYGFCQDRLYAAIQLRREDMKLYSAVARRLSRLVKPPDLVIHLDAAEPTLLGRIARRGRDFERAIGADFLATIRRACCAAAAKLPCRVVRVDCTAVDLRRRGPLAELLREIRRSL